MDVGLQKAPRISFGVSSINYCLVCSIPIHKIFALRGVFGAISVLLTMENSDDLEIWVPDWSRSLKVTLVYSLRAISYQSLIVPEAVFCTVYEIAFDRFIIALFCCPSCV